MVVLHTLTTAPIVQRKSVMSAPTHASANRASATTVGRLGASAVAVVASAVVLLLVGAKPNGERAP
jgi:hypothetical protein